MKTTTKITIYDAEGNPAEIEVCRPRIMALAMEGKIPNHLLAVATKMVSGKGAESGNIKEMGQMLELYCRVCMVNPTYDDIKSTITDEQMFIIFSWATSEVNKLKNFRVQQETSTDSDDGKELREKAV